MKVCIYMSIFGHFLKFFIIVAIIDVCYIRHDLSIYSECHGSIAFDFLAHVDWWKGVKSSIQVFNFW